jgi:tetratricopeptide (TPR) repeat protein
MRVHLVLGLVAALLASPAAADERPWSPEAKVHLDRGLELYEKKRYAEAIAEFEQGRALDPQPAFLYAQAQAERLSGDCEHAIGHYEQFLAQNPAPEREAAARANLGRCKDELARKSPPPTPAPSPTPPAITAAPAPPAPVVQAGPRPRAAEPAPWYADVLGATLVGGGTIALGVGSYLYAISIANEHEAQDAAGAPGSDNYDQHRARIDRAERQRTIGVITAGAGVLLVTGGVLRYLLRTREPAAPSVGLWTAPRAGGLTLEQRF